MSTSLEGPANTTGDVSHGTCTEILERFAAYPFSTDEEYQQGLAGIIESGVLQGKSEEEKAEILLRSEVFYFNRLFGSSLSVEDARTVRQGSELEPSHSRSTSVSATAPTSSSNDQEPQMLSFAQLKVLIEQGRTDEIPNNKVIPNVLSSEPPSESKAAPRKKPWEANTTA
ncbi:hypothetical protein BD414DRAFT_155140 [Trametes punicea]|nr:hypothetical protein BD414DRAFT_155140 [Trametes punicea]